MARQYKAPGIAVHQIIQPNAYNGIPDQNVAIVGPNATLRLYNTTAYEREKVRAATVYEGLKLRYIYDPITDEKVDDTDRVLANTWGHIWENEIGDLAIDEAFTKVYFRNALLRYKPDLPVIIPRKEFNCVDVDIDDFRGLTLNGAAGIQVDDVIGWHAAKVKAVSSPSFTVDNSNGGTQGVVTTTISDIKRDEYDFRLVRKSETNDPDDANKVIEFTTPSDFKVTQEGDDVKISFNIIGFLAAVGGPRTWGTDCTYEDDVAFAAHLNARYTIEYKKNEYSWNDFRSVIYGIEDVVVADDLSFNKVNIKAKDTSNPNVIAFKEDRATIEIICPKFLGTANLTYHVIVKKGQSAINPPVLLIYADEMIDDIGNIVGDVTTELIIQTNSVDGQLFGANGLKIRADFSNGYDFEEGNEYEFTLDIKFKHKKRLILQQNLPDGLLNHEDVDDTDTTITIRPSDVNITIGGTNSTYATAADALDDFNDPNIYKIEVASNTGTTWSTVPGNWGLNSDESRLVFTFDATNYPNITSRFRLVKIGPPDEYFPVTEYRKPINHPIEKAELFIVRDFQQKSGFTQTDYELRLIPGIEVRDEDFPNQLLEVVSADVYLEHRFWNLGGNISASHGIIHNLFELENTFTGPLHPDNPLKYAIYKALQNSGATPVIYAAVKNPYDIYAWQDAFNRLSKNRNAYEIVPLTDDYTVKRACVNWVLSESSDDINRRKECWVYQPLDGYVPIMNYTQDNRIVADVVDNPHTTLTDKDTKYVIAKKGDFLAAGVRPKDEFRLFLPNKNQDGTFDYVTVPISRVINSQTLLLEKDLKNTDGKTDRKPWSQTTTAEISNARFEIWRPISSGFGENVERLNVWNNRRVISVHPFDLEADGYRIPGYYGAVIAAARTAALPPNRASTLQRLWGIDSIGIRFDEYPESDLNALASVGTTLFTKDEDNTILIRHTLTTGDFETINEREEMSTRNFDNISNYYTATLMGLRGNIHATKEGLTAVYDALLKTSEQLVRRYASNGISGQLVDYVIVDIYIDPIFTDVINVHMNLELPHMANRIELYLTAVSENSAVGANIRA